MKTTSYEDYIKSDRKEDDTPKEEDVAASAEATKAAEEMLENIQK